MASTVFKRKERDETPVGARKKLWSSMDSEEERVAVVTPAQEDTEVAVVSPAQECTEPVRTLLQEPIQNGTKKSRTAPNTPSRPIRKAVATARTPEGELSSRSCDHQEWVDFHTWNQTYYTED